MSNAGINDIHAAQIRAWHLCFLRFAVTRDATDRDAFLARARDIDRGGHFEASAFTFFSRTSIELCKALLTSGDPQSRARLGNYLKGIMDDRLRRTLATAIEVEQRSAKPESQVRNRDYLWRGLERKSSCRA